MIKLLGSKLFFGVFLPLYAAILFLYPSYLSISHYEAVIFYEDGGYLGIITRFFCGVFGQNDFALRSFFIVLFLSSLPLFYLISKKVLRLDTDARVATVIFCLLPAAPLSALLVTKSAVIIFITLLFIYLYGIGRSLLSFAVLAMAAMLDGAFAILFLSLIFYAIRRKDNLLIAVSIALFGISMGLFGFDDGGRPRGYFLDTFGVYSLIFSPLLFLYFIFAIYKINPSERPIGWYISFWALLFSLLLSFRQKIMIYDFAPFVVVAIPFMLKTFFASYRIRIGKNKRLYESGFAITIVSLAAMSAISLFNYPIYGVLQNKTNHFAYNYQVAKELAASLKDMNIDRCAIDDREMALRLRFYGINYGSDYFISKKQMPNSKKVSIVYSNTEVAIYYVTKINVLQPNYNQKYTF